MSNGKMRGSLFATIKRYVKSEHSIEVYKATLEGVSPDIQEVFEGLLQYKEFYPAKAYQEFLASFHKQVGDEKLIESACFLADRELKGLWLVFSRLLSEQFLIKRMASMWEQLYTKGKIELLHNNDISSAVSITGFQFNPTHLIHAAHYMKTILERATRHTYSIKTKDLPVGAEFHFTRTD